MGKAWILDTETKGTGANMVPLEKTVAKPEPAAPKRRPRNANSDPPRRPRRERPARVERTATALPAGHVRKKRTGEIGKVLSVDARAGTATVRWLKRGATSTVRLSELSRT
jgi:hypothetical protein